MGAFIDKDDSGGVDAATVQSLVQMLDQYNSVAKALRMARNWCHSHASVNVELHLLSDRTNARQYNKPTVLMSSYEYSKEYQGTYSLRLCV